MPLAPLPEPFDHPDSIFGLKFNRSRALAYLENGGVRLVSRDRKEFKSFPDLCTTIAACMEADTAVLDGEIVYLDRHGRPEFHKLMRRPQHFYAFDILWLDGRDLRQLPLMEGKRVLRPVVPMQPAPVLYTDHFDGRGADLFRSVCEMDLEGIVAKQKDGSYTPEDTTWVKIKNSRYSQAEGRREWFESRRAAHAG